MAENSKIEWCKNTFNHVRGCTKVSPGCKNCYAETLSGRNPKTLGVWGPNGTRVVAAESAWKEPLKWNRQAACDCHHRADLGEKHLPSCPQSDRPRVFCASLADVFEDWQGPMETAQGFQIWKRTVPVEAVSGVAGDLYGGKWTTSDHYRDTVALTMDDVRLRLFRLIDATPHLDWLLLTKRPENVARMMPTFPIERRANESVSHRPNVWLGISAEDQPRFDERWPYLRAAPAAVRFVSYEPALGPLDLSTAVRPEGPAVGVLEDFYGEKWVQPDWVIAGGESGPGARPFQIAWARSLRDQCRAAGVAYFLKQLGAVVEATSAIDPIDQFPGKVNFRQGRDESTARISLIDKKGGHMQEWPEDLRVREFPEVDRG